MSSTFIEESLIKKKNREMGNEETQEDVETDKVKENSCDSRFKLQKHRA